MWLASSRSVGETPTFSVPVSSRSAIWTIRRGRRVSGPSWVKAWLRNRSGSRLRSASEVALGLGQHQAARLVFEQGDRIKLRVERAGDRVGLRERLADERERRRQANSVAQADPLEVGERLPGPDGGKRAPVVARELAPKLVCESGPV
jgi:hypothetical protein